MTYPDRCLVEAFLVAAPLELPHLKVKDEILFTSELDGVPVNLNFTIFRLRRLKLK